MIVGRALAYQVAEEVLSAALKYAKPHCTIEQIPFSPQFTVRYFGGSDFDSFVVRKRTALGLFFTAVLRSLLAVSFSPQCMCAVYIPEDQILYRTAGLLNAVAMYS